MDEEKIVAANIKRDPSVSSVCSSVLLVRRETKKMFGHEFSGTVAERKKITDTEWEN